MTENPVIYLGDTSLATAAAYLAGLMAHWRIGFDYVPSDVRADVGRIGPRRKLFILSDYPAKMLDAAAQKAIVYQVRHGAGLLMIGGWESYCGMGGDWAGTPVGDALPVSIANTDDRVNCDQPALLVKTTEHAITANLPWDDRAPTVGGFNRIGPKADATVILECERFAAKRQAGAMEFVSIGRPPMLVIGHYGKGRTAALATDVAPHWVGGLVDWGTGRVTAQAPGAGSIEVGDLYAQFFHQLINWTGNFH